MRQVLHATLACFACQAAVHDGSLWGGVVLQWQVRSTPYSGCHWYLRLWHGLPDTELLPSVLAGCGRHLVPAGFHVLSAAWPAPHPSAAPHHIEGALSEPC